MSKVFFTTPDGMRIPAVSSAEMKEIDDIAMHDFGLALLQMMENAGRNLAAHTQLMHDEGPIAVIAGAGGNGGGGLACARHLINRDVRVIVLLDRDSANVTGAAATQLRVLQATETPITTSPDVLSDATVLIDALIGYGLTDAPRKRARDYIDRCNAMDATVLSLDIPSGFDGTTGEAPGVAVKPDRTLTLALPKQGLTAVPGDIYLADIGIPKAVYTKLNIPYSNPFPTEYWVQLRTN